MIEKGKNYGWRIMEGFHCYDPPSGCDPTGLTLPIVEYRHSMADGCSITGGFVYRGTGVPALTGLYIYSDYCSGRIWGLLFDGVSTPSTTVLLDSKHTVSSFGTDEQNELYVCSYGDGKIYKFVQ